MRREFGCVPKLNIPDQYQFLRSLLTSWQGPSCALGKRSYSFTDGEDAVQFLFKDERFPADADILYDALRRVNIDFLTAGDKVTQFLTENLKAKVALLNKVLNKDDSKTVLSTKDEHPEWFQDLETNCTTKVSLVRRKICPVIIHNLYRFFLCFH